MKNMSTDFSEILKEYIKLMTDNILKVKHCYLPLFFSYRENTRGGGAHRICRQRGTCQWIDNEYVLLEIRNEVQTLKI